MKRQFLKLIKQIEKFNTLQCPSFDNNELSYGFFIKDDRKILSGLVGKIWMGALQVDRLFIHEEWRKKGLGTYLLQRAEDFGKQNNCKIATLESLSFQKAINFYKKKWL